MSKSLVDRVWNSALLWGFGLVVLRSAGFLLVMMYALRTLEPGDLGLWQVLLALVSLSGMVEIGLNMTIGRFASFFMGGAASVPLHGSLPPAASTNGRPNYAGIAGLIRMSRRIYAILAAIVTITIVTGWTGWSWWTGHPAGMRDGWLVGVYAVGAGFNMANLYWMGLMFGMNKVRLYQIVQMGGMLASYLIAAVGLRMGWGVAALVAGQLVMNAMPRLWARAAVLRDLPRPLPTALSIGWPDVWPITWRAGLVTAGSFLILPALSFVYSLSADLTRTASFGFTLQIALLLRGLSDTWVFVKWPWLTMALARGEVRAVSTVLVRRAALALVTYAAGAACLTAIGPAALDWIGSKTPLAGGWTFAGILLLPWIDFIPGVHSALLICMNRTPHAFWYLMTGIATAVAGTVAGTVVGPHTVIWVALVCESAWLLWRVPVATLAAFRTWAAAAQSRGGALI